MAATSLSLSLPWAAITNRVSAEANTLNRHANIIACSASENTFSHQERSGMRRPFLWGVGALLLPTSPLLAQENYEIFVDKQDGYSYYYPSDWREFDFRGHDSAFKDRYLQLQNVRLSFIPTDKSDIRDLGPIEEVVANLVKHVYSAPNQVANIMEMRERSTDGKHYCTFEYVLTSPNFSRAAFATIAIGNGRYYTLIVGANERRWRKFRNKLKLVADSFQVLDI
ncbi:photosynthetic NDH subunit of lumenal location 1, chloroplastic isoform X2 [Nicotiana tomentosiformis]|uniref:photosynthetic NDH subunit of lumenal location 1, chloroplastic isoform X2 n=1 Tax=Nicotiana tomentosiformis TaxID=4098 RepID=UPI00051C55C8|nr:photosynthetic NDH subunit of lumenal location 1, chloroplastic isoform X2 [Nicotiana tomentosiformis]